MSILGLFSRKSSNRTDAKSARGTTNSMRSRRGANRDTANLMDRVGRFEVSE